MLSTPRRELAVDLDLALEDTLDATFECFLSRLPPVIVDEGVEIIAVDFAQKLQQPHHRIVVEGDGAMVTLGRRVELRPAAGGILGLQNVIEALHERAAI